MQSSEVSRSTFFVMSNLDLGKVKAFAMTNQMVTEDLNRIEKTYGISLGHKPVSSSAIEEIYYPQFDADIRNNAVQMSDHYKVFYCLEKSIRDLVAKTFADFIKSEDWWESERIEPAIKDEVKKRIETEVDMGMTRRSMDELDYTTFGELSKIITSNWDIFGGLFSSRKAVGKVMTSLNSLRGPIAHCSILAEDEVIRLQLAVRDWFRLME